MASIPSFQGINLGVPRLGFTRIVFIVGLERADEGRGVSKELFPQGSEG